MLQMHFLLHWFLNLHFYFTLGTSAFFTSLALASHFLAVHNSTGVLEALSQVCADFYSRMHVEKFDFVIGCVFEKSSAGVPCG